MNNLKYMIIGIVVAFVASCQKDEDVVLTTLTVAWENIEASFTTAIIQTELASNNRLKVVSVEYATSSDFAESHTTKMFQEDGKYIVRLTDLQDETIYYLRYIGSNRFGSIVTQDKSTFTTLTSSIPILGDLSVTNIMDTTAIACVASTDNGGTEITEIGVCWSETENPTIETNRVYSSNINQLQFSLSHLQPNTPYYVRAYAVNKKGIGYSETQRFITWDKPKVQLIGIDEVSMTSAVLNGELLFDGNDTTCVKGFCWSNTTSPTIDNNYAQVNGNFAYSYSLTGLQDETIYYVRAYAQNKIGIVYSENKSFTTKAATLPTITTTIAKDISYTTASCGGNVTNDGGATITERGICYNTNPNPTTSNKKITSGTGIGVFTCNLTDLKEKTIYYVRAYSINKKGISYGEQVTFTTKDYSSPTVTTTTVTNVSYTTATCGGNVTDDGGATVTECGVCYSTNPNPTTSDKKITSGTGIGVFICNLTDLTQETTYYVRAYASNKKGIAYGNEVKFVTLSPYTVPQVTTSATSNITYTSATTGGKVLLDGGATIIERGVCYSATNTTPTITDTKIISVGTIGSFYTDLTNLLDGTNYYVRAYATNRLGTGYGDIETFTTIPYSIPNLITNPTTEISYTTASCSGTIVNDGGKTITERGICYATSSNPTIYNSKVISSSSEDNYTCNLSNLADETTYYARSYAINEKGVGYGTEISFTTKAYELPQVETVSVTDIFNNTAIVTSNVRSDGGLPIIERGVCYALQSMPTINDLIVTNSGTIGTFSVMLSSLSESTKYYIRAYAKNAKGITYGAQVSPSVGKLATDLGLSVKWAAMNVGAATPEGCGNYYAWGETTTKSDYSKKTYKFWDERTNTLTKYLADSYYGTIDNKITLELSDDAARANWGGTWRMPTKKEFQELVDNCTWTWTILNGVNGYIVISKRTGNSIFMPAAGSLRGADYDDISCGNYWSSSLTVQGTSIGAEFLRFSSSDVSSKYSGIRFTGMTIRPVCP